MIFTSKVPLEIGGIVMVTYKDPDRQKAKEFERSLGQELLQAGGMQ